MKTIKKAINEIKLTNSQKEEMFYKINNKKTIHIYKYSYLIILLIMIINIPVNNQMNNVRTIHNNQINNEIFKFYNFNKTYKKG